MSLVIFPRQLLVDRNGLPRVGAKAYFYEPNSSTPIELWTTPAFDVELANPVKSVEGGLFPEIYVNPNVNPRVKLVITDASDAVLDTQPDLAVLDGYLRGDLASEVAGSDGARLTGYRRDVDGAVGRTVYEKLFESVSVGDFGALGDGDADDSAAIEAAVDALDAGAVRGGALLLPGDANSVYNISDSLTIPPRASGDNHTRHYSISGMSRGSPRLTAITGMLDKPMVVINGQDASTYSFYREVKNLYLNGAGIAQRGIEAYWNQHYKIENVFITGLDFGTSLAGSAGIRVFGAICAQYRDVKVHNCDGYGIIAVDGSGNFFNANLVEGCSFLDVSLDGFYASGGWSGNAHIGNTHEFCGGYGMRLAGYSGTCGFIGGNYFESNGFGDFYFGEDTAANSVVCTGNYLNGYGGPGVSDGAYTPIRVKFADGIQITANMVAQATKSTTGFYILDANISGGSISNSYVANNMVRGLAATTAPNLVYNLPGTWVDFGNTLIDPIFAPLIPNNICRGRLPYGGWTLSVSGSGAAVKSANNLNGAPTLKLTRPGGGDTALITQTFTIPPEFKNRFVTFAIPVLANAPTEAIEVSIVPNGTSPQSTTISNSSLANGEYRIIYAMAFVPADATTIACSVTLTSAGGDFDIGHPCLYVGAQRWYSAAGEADWKHTAAPSTGTWTVGDKVWDSTPVSGQPMGWACGTAPATFIAMANYA